MISVGVSKLGRTSVFFVEPVKINGQYYRNKLLTRMLPEMNNLSRGDYIFLHLNVWMRIVQRMSNQINGIQILQI